VLRGAGDSKAAGHQRELEKENRVERDMGRRVKNIKPNTKRKESIKQDVHDVAARAALSIAAD
jgi:hypothetical protein